jgi:dipeptidyl aminopeptidase/acylaminoacyl peptidase
METYGQRAWVALVALSLLAHVVFASERTFSVEDAVRMVEFLNPTIGISGEPMFSPDGRYVVFMTARGLLDRNALEYTVWLWRSDEIARSLRSIDRKLKPAAKLLVKNTSSDSSSVICDLRWLEDSSALIYRSEVSPGQWQLSSVDPRSGVISRISLEGQNTNEHGKFDIRGRTIVWTIASSAIKASLDFNQSQTSIVGTGASLFQLLFPYGETAKWTYDWGELWASIDGKVLHIDTSATAGPLHINRWRSVESALALSPDGRFVVTNLPAGSVPRSWESYTFAGGKGKSPTIRAGVQDLHRLSAEGLTYQYVLIDIATGAMRPLLPAPDGLSGGFAYPYASAAWSPDGQSIALTNTYMPIEGESVGSNRQPCLAVVKVSTGHSTCVERIQTSTARDNRIVSAFRFDPSDSHLLVIYLPSNDSSNPKDDTRTYRETNNGDWTRVASTQSRSARPLPFEVKIEQDSNCPPKLVAVDTSTHVELDLLDPNEPIRQLSLGKATKLHWKDVLGRHWSGVLVTPPNFTGGKRYPLVIQAHGSLGDLAKFVASGSFTSAFAARPLAAAGIVVLQIDSDWSSCPANSSREIACELAGYEAAIEKLGASGLIDKRKMGIIGFSRTCLYTLAALSNSKFSFAAATINDGVMLGYFQYLMDLDLMNNGNAVWMNAMVGPPFGNGLKNWLRQSPALNIEKIKTPLRIEAVGHDSTLLMWEAYAPLRFLHRPVDLIVLREGTHPLTNPAQRMISQVGNVDWFRFWLQDYEDPSPQKAEQYARWRALRKLHPSESGQRQMH